MEGKIFLQVYKSARDVYLQNEKFFVWYWS